MKIESVLRLVKPNGKYALLILGDILWERRLQPSTPNSLVETLHIHFALNYHAAQGSWREHCL